MKVAFRYARKMVCVGVVSLFVSTGANAAFTCAGQIAYLALNPDGTLTFGIGFGTWSICNVSSPSTTGGYTFTAESCRAWFASMLAAQKSGDSIRLYFNTAASGENGPECSAIGHWVWPNPAPYHIHIMH